MSAYVAFGISAAFITACVFETMVACSLFASLILFPSVLAAFVNDSTDCRNAPTASPSSTLILFTVLTSGSTPAVAPCLPNMGQSAFDE